MLYLTFDLSGTGLLRFRSGAVIIMLLKSNRSLIWQRLFLIRHVLLRFANFIRCKRC